MVLRELSRVLEVLIPKDPWFLLLGIPNDIDIPRCKLLFCSLGLVVAKRDIAKHSGAPETPTLEVWKIGMDMYMAAERVTYKARGCPLKIFRIWGNWMQYYGLDFAQMVEAEC